MTGEAKKNIIVKLIYPGVAQLVARMVRVHEAVGSNPATRTKIPPFLYKNGGFFLLFVAKIELYNFHSNADHTNTTDGFPAGPQEECPVSRGHPSFCLQRRSF